MAEGKFSQFSPHLPSVLSTSCFSSAHKENIPHSHSILETGNPFLPFLSPCSCHPGPGGNAAVSGLFPRLTIQTFLLILQLSGHGNPRGWCSSPWASLREGKGLPDLEISKPTHGWSAQGSPPSKITPALWRCSPFLGPGILLESL